MYDVPSFLERYLTGECTTVWSDLVALGADAQASAYFEDAYSVATEAMRRVRSNVEILRDRLVQLGYAFRSPESAYVPPAADTSTMLTEIERLRGPIPLSLRAFYTEVGSVDFQQARSQLVQYSEPGRDSASELQVLGEEDPLVVAPVGDLLAKVRAFASTHATRIEFVFAADEFHKANYSGGENYHLWLPNPDADFRVEGMYEINEYFVAYLRATLASGGFRGRVEAAPEDESRIRKVAPQLRLIDALAQQLMPL
jgi:hypothetical protein